MTDIDFYILADTATNDRDWLACRLAEKIFKLKRAVHIHTGSAAHSQQMDELLWTFRDGSFLPHAIYQPDQENTAPVLISHHTEPQTSNDVLINLASEVPLFFSRFDRVAEIIGTDAQQKQHGRQRFRFYRDRGYNLKSHHVT